MGDAEIETLISEMRSLDHESFYCHRGRRTPFPLRCTVIDARARASANVRMPEGILPPSDLWSLWRLAAGLRLFEDTKYGQWGLVIWPVADSLDRTRLEKERREGEMARGDLVVGEFLGDSDLLIVRCDDGAPDYGHVMIALPIDHRCDWYRTSLGISPFLAQYMAHHGDKFWEIDGKEGA